MTELASGKITIFAANWSELVKTVQLIRIGLALLSTSVAAQLFAADITTIQIAYVGMPPSLEGAASSLDKVEPDRGLQGARLAIGDNNTTGQFLAQHYQLIEKQVTSAAEGIQVVADLIKQDIQLIVTDLPAASLLQLAQLPGAEKVLFLDASTRDDALRNQQCVANIVHLLPSHAMRADALAQYLLSKRWTQWLLLVGKHADDQLFAQALQRAAKRYRMKIVDQRNWTHDHDARRTAQKEIPVFTQASKYDVLMVADEHGEFGDYLPYRSWLPRPVVGTQGLFATAWHAAHEQWGALQLQSRFQKQAQRAMTEVDYGAWLAVRSLGEAASRSKAVDAKTLHRFLFSEEFSLAGFKGRALSFRSWNGQLRQPVLLVWPKALVAVAPSPEFLHPTQELDTLGYDQPETVCQNKVQKES